MRNHAVILVGYLLLVSGIKAVLGKMGWDTAWLWAGGIGGFVLVQIDRLIYVYWLKPEEQLSIQLRDLVRERRWRWVWLTLQQHKHEQRELVFRSSLTAAVWVVVAVFGLTSAGSKIAGGLVMGMGLHLVYDFWRDQWRNPLELNYRLFWPIKRGVSEIEQRWFVFIFTAVFVGLTILAV